MKILDLTNPERSDIAYTRMRFPDGQPHLTLTSPEQIEGAAVEVLCRINGADAILDLALAMDCIRSVPTRVHPTVSVNIAYMPGRMDRRIAAGQPFTLERIAALLNVACEGAWRVRILDPHSEHTLRLVHKSEPVYPDRLVDLALEHFGNSATVVIPDEGAVFRTSGILGRLGHAGPVARCVKKRDSETGKLSGFALIEGDVKGRDCLIVDDLCDGGGTFAGISEVLRARWAEEQRKV